MNGRAGSLGPLLDGYIGSLGSPPPPPHRLPGTTSRREPFALSVQENQSLGPATGNLAPAPVQAGFGRVPASCAQGLGNRGASEPNHLSKPIFPFSIPIPHAREFPIPSLSRGGWLFPFTNWGGEEGEGQGQS